jgi:hypothetical protein
VKAFTMLVVLGLATPVQGETLRVVGQAGYLGEWDLTATVALRDPSRPKEYSGPLTMTHVGMCTQDGPETKTGEMRLQKPGWTSRMTVTLQIDGVACSFSGKLSDAYTGMMTCPDRRAVPLTLWLK